MHNTLKIVISFAVSFSFLYLAFQGIDMDSFGYSLEKTRWWVIAVALIMPIFSMMLRGWRWQLILRPLKPIPFSSTLSFTFIGFMANNVLPAHAGELVKPYLLGKKEDVPLPSLLATVVLERVLDSIALIFMLLPILFLLPIPAAMKYGGMGIGVANVVIILLLTALASDRYRLQERILWLAGKLPKRFSALVSDKISTFFQGLSVLRGGRDVLLLLLISLMVWLHIVLTIYLIMLWMPVQSTGEVNLWLAAMTVLIFLAFAIVLPSSPGYVGVTQWAFKYVLGFFAINEVDAVAASIIFNLTQYVPITLGGIIYLFKEGLTFKHILVSDTTTPDTKLESS